MNSEQIGKVNQSVKGLLLQVKSLASSLPDVAERDTGTIVSACQEVSRLLLALIAQLRDAGDTAFGETIVSELRTTVQSFLSLVKSFVADETFDDDRTNDAVLAVTAAIKPVIDVVNKRKTTLLQESHQTPVPPPVVTPVTVTAAAVTVDSEPVVSSVPETRSAAQPVQLSPPISPRQDKDKEKEKEKEKDESAADDADEKKEKASDSSFLRKMSRSISNASEKMRAKLKRAPTADSSSPPAPASTDDQAAAASSSSSSTATSGDSDSKREKANKEKGAGFMGTLRSRFRLPQGWWKIKLSKEKKQDAKEKLESDLEQVDAAESGEIVQKLKKLDDENVTAGDVGDIAIAVQAARVNLETRVSSASVPDNTRARESILRLKAMEKTLAETLRSSIILAAPIDPKPDAAAEEEVIVESSSSSSSKPVAKPASPVAKAAPPVDDTAELDELLGGIDEKATLVELDALLEDPAALPPAATSTAAASNAEENEWGAIENLLSEYA